MGNNMDIYALRDECNIERSSGRAILINSDGEILFEVSDKWTDEQIFKTLDICNEVFRKGKDLGREEKSREIKKALNIISQVR